MSFVCEGEKSAMKVCVCVLLRNVQGTPRDFPMAWTIKCVRTTFLSEITKLKHLVLLV